MFLLIACTEALLNFFLVAVMTVVKCFKFPLNFFLVADRLYSYYRYTTGTKLAMEAPAGEYPQKKDFPFAFEKTPIPRISVSRKLVPVQLEREYEVKVAY